MLSWIVAGVEYSLDNKGITRLLEHDGFGMPAIQRLTVRGALQDGDFDRGYRISPRVVMLTLSIEGTTHTDFYAKRSKLVTIFKPRNTHGTLMFRRDDVVMALDCHLVGGLQFSDKDREHLFQKCVVVLKANNPTWYNPTGKSSIFSLGAGADSLLIPTEVPFKVGASALNTNQNISYKGTARVFPRIQIIGPVTDCILTHVQMGWKLDFTGTTIGAGEYFEVDLRYGYKTIKDQDGVNQLSTLSDDSDLAEFSLLPDPDVGGGINSIRMTGDIVDASTAVTLTYYERFIGL